MTIAIIYLVIPVLPQRVVQQPHRKSKQTPILSKYHQSIELVRAVSAIYNLYTLGPKRKRRRLRNQPERETSTSSSTPNQSTPEGVRSSTGRPSQALHGDTKHTKRRQTRVEEKRDRKPKTKKTSNATTPSALVAPSRATYQQIALAEAYPTTPPTNRRSTHQVRKRVVHVARDRNSSFPPGPSKRKKPYSPSSLIIHLFIAHV
jgi:hypothetical protein